jgi:hypothetical protein
VAFLVPALINPFCYYSPALKLKRAGSKRKTETGQPRSAQLAMAGMGLACSLFPPRGEQANPTSQTDAQNY